MRTKIIPDILNLICSYISETFNPQENYNLYLINPKFYPHYAQDLLNYKVNLFLNLYNYLKAEFEHFANFCIRYKEVRTYCGLKKKLVPVCHSHYSFNTFMCHMLYEFRKAKLKIPFQRFLKYNKNVLTVRVKDHICNLSFDIRDTIIFKGIKISYFNLSIFWKLIYIIMYIVSTDAFPYHLNIFA